MASEKDVVTVNFLQRNEVFADAFNFALFGGEPCIDPESLVKLDTRQVELPYGGEAGAKVPVERFRDVVKMSAAMTDHHTAYLILALEGQSEVHMAMPVRNMVYDGLQYAAQVREARQSHQESQDFKGSSRSEYLSGFLKTDKLIPVVTLVIYFGDEEWDGPMSIHEMFGEMNPRLAEFVPDYRINLIAPAAVDDDEFDKFQSTLREVLQMIKCKEDQPKMEKMLQELAVSRWLNQEEADMVSAYLGVDMSMYSNGREDEDMLCGALQGMVNDAVAKATKEAEDRFEQERREEQRAEQREYVLAMNAEGLSEETMARVAKTDVTSIREILASAAVEQ